ncbi:hypothetical protein DFJ58DRAFT_846157 [Suillus subalutaceus]|uniref:uncharacterized protein n=1 Tax=Suillus subalutaceus TaxID=48586 RepID=UPI001B8842E2|nr:uncharacterized protein DFJ58DRAFT_846157 [Suillus subalutaceus]KAG1838203.1 hypothetical protein DFJ58DRAFT_846157 [Suillus subalutaceus]
MWALYSSYRGSNHHTLTSNTRTIYPSHPYLIHPNSPTPPEKVNQASVNHPASVLQLGDFVWIHDYHLLSVPRMLRNAMHSGADHQPFHPYAFHEFGGIPRANLIWSQTYTRHFTFIHVACALQGASVVPCGARDYDSTLTLVKTPLMLPSPDSHRPR